MSRTAIFPPRLGVNIDHVATLRQARGAPYPSVLQAAYAVADAGADLITVHLREDRRHIQDRDVELIRECVPLTLNLEMAVTAEMLGIASVIKPDWCCLVPEKRAELTTEGGLDVIGQEVHIAAACERLNAEGIKVSLFIDPTEAQLAASQRCGAAAVELHTGEYGDAIGDSQITALTRIQMASAYGEDIGLAVHAGHGLHYHNVQAVAAIPQIQELNIGHAIVSRAVFSGLDNAVRDMRALIHGVKR